MGGQISPSSNIINKQVVIVTGASGGIGLELAKELCQRSAHVIMACKDMTKAEEQKQKIIKSQPDAHIECRYMDLKSFDCVRRFVRSIEKDFDKVDILINNAGLIFNAKEKSVDGFEIHLQVNYLSHFLLTSLLLPHLQRAEQGRIINTCAHAYSSAKMTEEDPLNIGQWATAYHHRDAFAHSKLAVILSTQHLAKLLKGTFLRYFISYYFFFSQSQKLASKMYSFLIIYSLPYIFDVVSRTLLLTFRKCHNRPTTIPV